MTSTVATEIPQATGAAKSHLETWGRNERMRHIPPASWLVRKIEGDLRRRIEIVCASFEQMAAGDAHRTQAESALTALCRGLERVAETAKHTRTPGHGGDISSKVREALQHAIAGLNALDENLFGRRYPYQTHERSKAEPLVGALLAAIDALGRAVEVLRKTDPSLDEKLLDGLVTLQTPLRKEPIA
jgi:hypothetical protein